MKRTPIATAALSLVLLVPALVGDAAAQPPPSFQASCGDLRAKMSKLGPLDSEAVIVIAVQGELTIASHNGVLAYMSVCRKPDPQVLCVTYGLSGHKVGDEVVLTGTLARVGPDHIMLDPCLNSPPDRQ